MQFNSRNPPCWSSKRIGTPSYERWYKEWCCGISSTTTPATQPSDCVVDEEVAMEKCLNMEKWREILLKLLNGEEELQNRNPSCQRYCNSAEQLETANRLKVQIFNNALYGYLLLLICKMMPLCHGPHPIRVSPTRNIPPSLTMLSSQASYTLLWCVVDLVNMASSSCVCPLFILGSEKMATSCGIYLWKWVSSPILFIS